MKRTLFFNPLLWLTTVVGCTGLLTATPQPAIAQTSSTVLLAQQSSEVEELKRLLQQAYQFYDQG